MRKIYFLVIGIIVLNGLQAQVINIPDPQFKNALLASSPQNLIAYSITDGTSMTIDANSNGEIEVSEALQVRTFFLNNLNISNLEGIQYFTNLEWLQCYNNLLTVLDVSTLPYLQKLECDNNQLTSLNVSGLIHLTQLTCYNNSLTVLDASDLPAAEVINCYSNQLQTLDVSNDGNLQILGCNENQLTSINFAGAINLNYFTCGDNHLTSLDLSGLHNLSVLHCYNNELTLLTFNDNPILSAVFCSTNLLTSLTIPHSVNQIFLGCSNNNLQELNIKNGSDEEQNFLSFQDNPNLHYICADENEISGLQNKLVEYGYDNCEINSYCSFVPGAAYYSIQGSGHYDANSNGCDIEDFQVSNLKVIFSNGIQDYTGIADNNGNYSVPVLEGTHTITPVIQNTEYFTVSPLFSSVTFPQAATPFIQDFCVTANGSHNDLEVEILPIGQVIPGFDSGYIILYQNKGTTTQSGSISFAFNDDTGDFVSALPAIISQSGNVLNWNFTALKPFEKRTISVTINMNSPQEEPPLQLGAQLQFIASVSGTADEFPVDNLFILEQGVVNSFDPNDKTCLEGNTITPEMIGKYVHYMIRFENTGTANAQNIVVKDVIDTSKFDISSLILLDGSHPFVTRITDTNKVEFIFENIQLPFDNVNNDGYVAFKIKTKPTLVVGDTFSNTANIYFDYNAPIITNTATTAIQVLGTDDFDFNNHFTLYPNPAKDILNIKSKDNAVIHSLSVYNILGQILMTITNPVENINVSQLTSGNYFIKITSDAGVASTKFIKK